MHGTKKCLGMARERERERTSHSIVGHKSNISPPIHLSMHLYNLKYIWIHIKPFLLPPPPLPPSPTLRKKTFGATEYA